MSNWPENIARKAIVDFAAYSARGGSTGALHLDANESPYAPPPVKGTQDYNRYPEQQPPALLQRLADLYGTTTDRVMVGPISSSVRQHLVIIKPARKYRARVLLMCL